MFIDTRNQLNGNNICPKLSRNAIVKRNDVRADPNRVIGFETVREMCFILNMDRIFAVNKILLTLYQTTLTSNFSLGLQNFSTQHL